MNAVFHIIVQTKGFNTVFDYPYGNGCALNSGVYTITYYATADSTTTSTATYNQSDYLVYVVPLGE